MRKRIVLLFLFLVLARSLSGCLIIDKTYPLLHSVDKIETIEVYLLDENVSGKIPETAIPVAYIDSEDYEAFCSDLQGIEFTNLIILFPVTYDPSWHLDGYVVKIIYDTGGYDVIGPSSYQYQQEADGSHFRARHYTLKDQSVWDPFIEKYIKGAP